MTCALALMVAPSLVHLSSVDLVIIVFYFALVLAIGLYLKERANTGEDFFMAGREMTAWVFAGTMSSVGMWAWAKVDPGGIGASDRGRAHRSQLSLPHHSAGL